MRKVLFSGYYGHGNAGDDVFCSVAALASRHVDIPYEPWFISRVGPRLSTPVVHVFGSPSRTPDRVRLGVAATRCRHVVQFGGSTLQRLTAVRTDLMRMARRRIIHLSAVGVSVGPFDSIDAERDVARFLRSCRDVVVRDVRSLDLAQSLGIDARLGYDPAVLLPRLLGVPSTEPTINDRPIVAVSASSAGLSPERAELRHARLARLLRAAQRDHGATVRLINMHAGKTDGDSVATARLAQELTGTGAVEVRCHSDDVAETSRAIGECDLAIGVRLHLCVLAYTSEVPFVQIDYHPKCADFLSTVGAPWARADTTIDNLDEVGQLVDHALIGRARTPALSPGSATHRSVMALRAAPLWHGMDLRSCP